MAGAIEFRAFDVTCPPGTDPSAPVITNLVMPARQVNKIRVRVPSGPLSSMGFQLGMAETAILPFNDGSWIIADNETFEWDNQGWPNSGAWQAIMYNTGQYPHTIYIYMTVELPDIPPVTVVGGLLSAQVLGSALSAPVEDSSDQAAIEVGSES